MRSCYQHEYLLYISTAPVDSPFLSSLSCILTLTKHLSILSTTQTQSTCLESRPAMTSPRESFSATFSPHLKSPNSLPAVLLPTTTLARVQICDLFCRMIHTDTELQSSRTRRSSLSLSLVLSPPLAVALMFLLTLRTLTRSRPRASTRSL